MTLALYHYNLSVCSQKVRLCLAEKGLDWVDHQVDLMRFENLRPEYLALNPHGVVPTLVHDGRVVRESSVIIEYLDDAFPDPPLRPTDPYARAEMRLWLKLEDDTGLPSVGVLTFQRLLKPQMQQRSPEEMARMLERHPDKARARLHAEVRDADLPPQLLADAEAKLVEALDQMESVLAGRPWLAGDVYSLAEVTWLPFLERMVFLGMSAHIDAAAHPQVADWHARARARPSYQRAIVDYLRFPTEADAR